MKCLGVVKRVDLYIAGIDATQALVHANFHLLAVVSTADRRLTNAVRTKPCARPVGHHSIVRNAEQCEIELLVGSVGNERQTTERCDTTESRLTSFWLILQLGQSHDFVHGCQRTWAEVSRAKTQRRKENLQTRGSALRLCVSA